jgi:hypothetical protein
MKAVSVTTASVARAVLHSLALLHSSRDGADADNIACNDIDHSGKAPRLLRGLVACP